MTGNNIFAINQEALQKFEGIAIRRLIQKLDWRILPCMLLIEVGSYLNWISTGHAKIMNIEKELNLAHYDVAWSISVFFLGYLIFAIPCNIFMRYIGPTGYISLSMIAWGSLTIGGVFVKNGRQLIAVQFFLGVTQAAFFPSMIIYFSLWYRKRDQIMRISLLFAAAILASGLGCILAYGFRHMDGIRGLHDWQWMFLFEGLPMIPLGIITYLFLSNVPNTVQWLSNIEKQLLTNLLLNDTGTSNRESNRFSWRQVFHVFIDIRIYLYALIVFGNHGTIKYVNTYFPLLVDNMISLSINEHLMAIPLYAFTFVFCLLVCYSSSRRHEFGFHIMFCLFVALAGFILMIVLIDRNRTAAYICKCIACSGSFASYPITLSWLTNNISGHTKRSIAVGFVIGVGGQISGVIIPFIYFHESPQQRNDFICIGLLMTSLIFTIILRFCLMIENHRRDRLSKEQYDKETAIAEPCDWHPEVRYIL